MAAVLQFVLFSKVTLDVVEMAVTFSAPDSVLCQVPQID
jgi:hypothetical protein